MNYIFNFPDIGEGLDEGTILKWYITEGDYVKAGQPIVNMETDKVVTDIPSPKNGKIVRTYGIVGDIIRVGGPLVEIEMEGAAMSSTTLIVEEAKAENEAGVVGTLETAGASPLLAASEEIGTNKKAESNVLNKAIATPHSRAIARSLDIDINEVVGTGPSGRVTKEDVENYKSSVSKDSVLKNESAEQQNISELVSYEPLTQIRKTIAKNMLNSKLNAAHMALFEEVEVTELIAVRERFKKKYADQNIKLTYLPFIVKATAKALKKHRQLNSQLDMENNRMIYKNYYNIAIAVDTPEGLVVPVIRNADKLSIFEIALKISELSEKAHNRSLTMEDLKDGTFTLTNFGSIGGIFGTPVINYPQAGILGIGRLMKTPIVKNDQIVIGNILPLSLSADHRIVDGGEASRFMNSIIAYLSNPVSMLMD